jgi:hypothetical protein
MKTRLLLLALVTLGVQASLSAATLYSLEAANDISLAGESSGSNSNPFVTGAWTETFTGTASTTEQIVCRIALANITNTCGSGTLNVVPTNTHATTYRASKKGNGKVYFITGATPDFTNGSDAGNLPDAMSDPWQQRASSLIHGPNGVLKSVMSAVPEPSTVFLTMVGGGLVLVGSILRRRALTKK